MRRCGDARRLLCWALGGMLWAGPLCAQAAGLFLAPRGVRPLALGGAYVAGANDLNALSYNPAGLAQAERGVLLDAALPLHTTTLTPLPGEAGDTLYGRGLKLPSPTLGAVFTVPQLAALTFGAALLADYPAMQNWSHNDATSPARYGASDFRGTAMAKAVAAGAYRLTDSLALGLGGQLLLGTFTAQNIISTCDGVICTQPQNAAYDAHVRIRSRPLAVLGGQVGAQWQVASRLRLGLAWESGYRIHSGATLRVRLPSAPLFAAASLSPDTPQGRISMRLPWQLRSGAQLQLGSKAHLEAAFVYEPWSVNDRIDIILKNASIDNLLALGSFRLTSLAIAQGFVNTYSLRLGGELRPDWFGPGAFALRAGVMYEPSAVPNAMTTPMAANLDTLLAASGVRMAFGRWQLDATFAYLHLFSRTVTQSAVGQINAVGASETTPVGNGIYRAQARIFGLGLQAAL